MTTEEIIALAKEKLGKDITEQEAQEYLSGATPLPDEALDLVSGGGCRAYNDLVKGSIQCPVCGTRAYEYTHWSFSCYECQTTTKKRIIGTAEPQIKWEITRKCPVCQCIAYFLVDDIKTFQYRCPCGNNRVHPVIRG